MYGEAGLQLKATTDRNKIVFKRASGHPVCDIEFKRTLRVPDNADSSNLPADCGQFPLFKVHEYKTKLPLSMSRKGGVFIPMYRKYNQRVITHGTK